IAHAEDIYEQFSGSPVPDSGGTEPSPDPDPASGTEDCAGSSINPGSEVGAVAEGPSGEEGCVNIGALTQPSAALSCPDGPASPSTPAPPASPPVAPTPHPPLTRHREPRTAPAPRSTPAARSGRSPSAPAERRVV